MNFLVKILVTRISCNTPTMDPHTLYIAYIHDGAKVLDYYDKFKKSGDPLKSPIDQTEFLEIMQVQNFKSIFTV